jgi:hypothetical protein
MKERVYTELVGTRTSYISISINSMSEVLHTVMDLNDNVHEDRDLPLA